MIRKKLVPPPAPSGIRKKLGLSRTVFGHVLFECAKCKTDPVMKVVPGGFQPHCPKCQRVGEVRADELSSATLWNVTP